MFKKTLLCLLLLPSLSWAGENYLLVEGGKSRFVPNGLWADFKPITDFGYSSTSKDQSNTWSIGLGQKLGKIGSVELAYHDLGSSTSFAGYPNLDPNDPRLPAGCQYPCGLPTQWVSHYASAKAVSFSVLPEYDFGNGFAVYARAGLALYRAHFEYKIAHAEGAVVSTQFSGENSWNYTGVSPVYGLGLRYGQFYVEARKFATVEAKDAEHGSGSFKGINTFTVGLRMTF